MDLIELDETNIEEFLKDKTCYVEFGIASCGSCAIVEHLIKTKLIPKYKNSNITFCHVDAVNNPSVKETFKLRFYPTCIVFKNGIEQKRSIGVRHLRDDQILKVLDDVLAGRPIPKPKPMKFSDAQQKQIEEDEKRTNIVNRLSQLKLKLEKIRKEKENVTNIRKD